MSRELERRIQYLERAKGVSVEPIAIMITPIGSDKQRIEVQTFVTDGMQWQRLPDETIDAFVDRVDIEAHDLSRDRKRAVIVHPEL